MNTKPSLWRLISVRALLCYCGRFPFMTRHNRLFVTSNFHLDPSRVRRFPPGAVSRRHEASIIRQMCMILRTPIISESYSPDEVRRCRRKNAKHALGYMWRTGSQIGQATAIRRFLYLQRDVLYWHCAVIFGWRLMRDVTGLSVIW